VAASILESQNDSYIDESARLQDILDFDLPKLRRWCEKTFEALVSLTSSEPAAEERKNLNTARKSFELARRSFAEDGSTYIDLSSSNLPYGDDPNALTTIHEVTSSANLISILLSLNEINRSRQTILPFLQELDSVFPTLTDLDPSTQLESQSLAFRVRGRRLVELLGEEPKAESRALAATVFCGQSPSTSEEALQWLRKGPYKNLGGMKQGGDYTSSKRFKIQMAEINANFLSAERPKADQLLNEAFPRDELLKDLRAWAIHMYVYVNKNAHENDPPPDDQILGGPDDDGVEQERSEGSLPSEKDRSEASSYVGSNSEHEYHKLKTITKE
jgi:hypothetical protein